MTNEVAAAIAVLQQLCFAEQAHYWTERFQYALDELVRHPDRTEPTRYLVRNAVANAAKKLRHRQTLVQIVFVPHLEDAVASPPVHWLGELLRYLSQRPGNERCLLAAVALGWTPREIAESQGRSSASVRVSLSRARASARHDWYRENGDNGR